jgi:hypothetical protein
VIVMQMLTMLVLLIAVLIPIESRSQTPAPLRIPLRTGLTIVTALNDPDRGDYESIKQFFDVNDKTARLRYTAEIPNTDDDNPLAALLGGGRGPKPAPKPKTGATRSVETTRSVNRVDLENATDYRLVFNENAPAVFPGSTAVGVSRKVLTGLTAGKYGRRTRFPSRRHLEFGGRGRGHDGEWNSEASRGQAGAVQGDRQRRSGGIDGDPRARTARRRRSRVLDP